MADDFEVPPDIKNKITESESIRTILKRIFKRLRTYFEIDVKIFFFLHHRIS